MEVVIHLYGIRKILLDGRDVCRAQIGGYGLYLCLALVQPFPELLQRVRSFSVTNKHDLSVVKIHYDSLVHMPFLDGEFIDADMLQSTEIRAVVSTIQIPFLDILDRIPGYPK